MVNVSIEIKVTCNTLPHQYQDQVSLFGNNRNLENRDQANMTTLQIFNAIFEKIGYKINQTVSTIKKQGEKLPYETSSVYNYPSIFP